MLTKNRCSVLQCLLIIGVGVAIATTSGCTPLRKKFVREKKADKENDPKFTPVLDPVEYAEREESAEDAYKYHYSLWKVWNKDLLQTIEGGGSDKRQKYLINQALEQMRAMNDLLNEQSRAKLGGLIGDMEKVLKEFDKPSALRSKFSVRSKVQRCARQVRADYTPSIVFQGQP